MTQTLDRLMRHIQDAWFQHGVMELCMGAVLIVVAVALALTGALMGLSDARTGLALAALLAGPLVSVVTMVVNLARGGTFRAIQRRLAYPLNPPIETSSAREGRRRGTLSFSGIMGALTVVSSFATPDMNQAFVLALSIGLGMLLLLLSHHLGKRRFQVLAGLSAVAGVLVALVDWDILLGSAAYTGLMGASLLLSGLFALRAYLLHNQLRLP